jgi:uncharacterized membrane protein
MIDSTTVAGLIIPSGHPLFLAGVAVHVLAGLTCVVAGAVAMLAPKGRGRHSRAGTVYYRSLAVVFATMTGLAFAHWAEDAHLFLIGCASFASVFVGHRSISNEGARRVRVHIAGMGTSYVLLLVAFYVDNGKQLPVWNRLPHVAYWLIPVVVGLPLILRAYSRHPLARLERG